MDRQDRIDIYEAACEKAVGAFSDSVIISGDDFNFEKSLDTVKNIFQNTVCAMGANRWMLPERSCSDLAIEGWADSCKNIRERCLKVLHQIEKERRVVQIRRTIAEAVIAPKIKELGFPYRFNYQKYRLKVSLKITPRRHFDFYVKYRDFNNSEIIDGISERTGAVVEYIKIYGPQLSLKDNRPEDVWNENTNE